MEIIQKCSHGVMKRSLPQGIQEDFYNYNGPGPALWHDIGSKFQTVLEACYIASGFMYHILKRITANLKAYADCHKK